MAHLAVQSAAAFSLPRPIDPPTQDQTAAKTHNFLTSVEGGVTLFSILAGVAVAIAWSVPFGLLGASLGIAISAALFFCRSSTPVAIENGQRANPANSATSAPAVTQQEPPEESSGQPVTSLATTSVIANGSPIILDMAAQDQIGGGVQDGLNSQMQQESAPVEFRVKTFSHEQNKAIYAETMEYAENFFSATCMLIEKYSRVIQPDDKGLVKADYTGEMHPKNIHVMNASTMRATQALVAKGLNPLVLDMAYRYHAGGGVKFGSNSQEEIIIRQSTLMYGLQEVEKNGGYPMPEFGGIFVPGVAFFRADPNEDYAYLDTPFTADVYAMAAYNCKPGKDRPVDDDAYRKGTVHKIATYLRFAKANGNDALVAGAFGCGDFKNDAHFIASIFQGLLETKEFAGYFKEVAFAIINNHNGGNNFEKFQSVFEA